jgi:Uma2 family endonuclease
MTPGSCSDMSTHSHSTDPNASAVPVVPQLETGDCLTRPEFERRYEAMPWLKKAELIDGVVYVGSPVGPLHADAHAQLMVWLGTYAAQTPGTRCSDNATVRLDMLNEVQPDALLRLMKGGQSKAGDDMPYLEGAPELAAEVASSTVSRDLHAKLNLYLRHGVREYIVWRVLDNDVDWFRLEEGEYRRLAPGGDGIFRSLEFPGLWLDRAALLRGDMSAVLNVLNQGLASPEHVAFAIR